MINFLDFEVLKYDWMVVIKNPFTKERTVIINDRSKLCEFYYEHRNEIYAGYNIRNYDNYIYQAILCHFDPFKVSDFIINKKQPGWKFSDLLKKYELNSFDVQTGRDKSLKQLEAFMGHNIEETKIPFDIDRKLGYSELQEEVRYCEHDVDECMEAFLKKREEFDTMMFLIKTFKLPISTIGKTKAQAVADVLQGNRRGKSYKDEFDYEILPWIKINKYIDVLNFYKNAKEDTLREMKENELKYQKWYEIETSPTKKARYKKLRDKCNWRNEDTFKEYFYSRSLDATVMGIAHSFGWGGVHAGLKKYKGEGIYVMADVQAYYPSMMLKNKWGYRVMDAPEKFEIIHNQNIKLKLEGKKKERAPFKIADNAITGQFKEPNSKIYDPKANNNICVNGQLQLLDLIERIEESGLNVELIQSNTDGLFFKLSSMDDYYKLDDIVYEWEQRTGMTMEFDVFKKVYQGDVNNYLIINNEGKTKAKGSYVKDLNELDNDLPIVNEAIKEFILKNVPVEKTINECDELIKFQK